MEGWLADFGRVHAHGVLAYFVRRTGEGELALELTAETFAAAAAAARRGRSEPASGCVWLYAIARDTLSDSLRVGRVRDTARRRAGPDAGWVALGCDDVEAATPERLAEFAAGLPPALRETMLQRRDTESVAERLRSQPRRAPRRARFRVGRESGDAVGA